MKFKPVYEELNQYYENSKEFQMLSCDSSVNKNTKRVFKISSFPSIVLYDSKTKQVQKFDQSRNLINLVNFINDNTDVINEEIGSKVTRIENPSSKLDKINKSVVVLAFSQMEDWEEYEFPSHEYQQLAYKYPEIKFKILFVDLTDNINEFLRNYRISNFPSVVYFESRDKFKLYKTFSTSHMSNDKLLPQNVEEFMKNLNDDTQYGTWFNNFLSLYEFMEHQQYEFVDLANYGFNIRQHGRGENQDMDMDYQEMVEELEIWHHFTRSTPLDLTP